jgi:hypothetical protein
MKETRYARLYIWVDPDDCDPPHTLDLTPGSRDLLKVDMLTEAFIQHGFNINEPCLVGYPLDGRIQLLSGTHRHEAAKRAEIKLPVHLVLRSIVEACWGNEDAWTKLIRDIPVRELECAIVPDNTWVPGIDERIDVKNIPEH